jgi:UDP:flavonoid glycosyltransferase YjiC (YdhE family)
MGVSDPARTTALILDALKQSGQRGILHAGWAKLGASDLPDSVFALDYAPYAWLFPRMAAVIHHGGSGTTGLALRSGMPSLVIPFTGDQPFWGKRTHDLGVGPAAIPFARLTADRLAAAIRTMTSDAGMQARAATLGEGLAGEDGIARAVEVIRTLLHDRNAAG